MSNAKRPARMSPTVRGSYVTLAQARGVRGGTPSYSITLMLDKNNPEHMQFVNELYQDLEATYKEQFPNKPLPPLVANQPGMGPKIPIKDGDVAVNDQHQPIKVANPEYAGHFIVTASKKESSAPRPLVCGPNLEPVDPAYCQSGFWYRVNLNAYAYVNSDGGGSGGVSLGLNGVQFVREDATFGGGGPRTADAMFAPIPGGAPMQQPGMMPQGAPMGGMPQGAPMGGMPQSAPMSQPMQPAGPAAPVMPTAAPGAPMAAPAFPGAAAGYNPNPLG